MIEQIILEHLSANLDYPVKTMKDDALDEYVLIEKTGGGESDHIDRATIAVQSYADSLYGASHINGLVKKAMKTVVTHPNVSRCKCTDDYNFTDTTTHKYRYQALFEVVFFDD